MIKILEPYINNSNSIVYPVIINDKDLTFNISYNNITPKKLNLNIDGIVIMLSSIAICNNLKIHSTLPIDKTLYNNLQNLPDFYKQFKKEFNKNFENNKLILDLPTVDRVNNYNLRITPISMGIDSLHTIISNRKNLDNIIYIDGLDLSNCFNFTKHNISKISRKLNIPLIYSFSDFKKKIRELKLGGTNYGVFNVNSIILACCYPLGINSLYFSGAGHDTFPCLIGEHYELLKYYTSEQYKLFHNNALRIKKIYDLREFSRKLFKIIRVCNDDYNNNHINCGKCGKCLVTMLYMHILGYRYEITKMFLHDNYRLIENNLFSFHKAKKLWLSSTYYAKIYKEIIDLYISNKNKSLENIINQYHGKFKNEDFYLYTVDKNNFKHINEVYYD